MWIQKPDKTFIKTINVGLSTMKYVAYFTSWRAITAKKLTDLDGLTGATREDHNGAITAT
jgi:hypothetical protein